MTVLFNGFARPHLEHALQLVARHIKASECWCIDVTPAAPCAGLEVRHIPFREVVRARYPAAELWRAAPVDEPTLVALAEVETTVLKMMDRLGDDRGMPSYEERHAMYVRHVRYWQDFLRRNRIELFVLSNFPHEMHDYVIYELCRRGGIRTLNLGFSPVDEAAFVFTDWRQGPLGLRERFEELLAAGPGVERPPLTGPFAKHWQGKTKEKAETPFYIPAYKKQLEREQGLATSAVDFTRDLAAKVRRSSRSNKLRRLLEPSLWTRNARRFLRKRAVAEKDIALMRDYDARTAEPTFDAPFVYVPLHYQPEMTTCPLGGAFAHQELMVQILAASLPTGWLLYVKEHPVQRALGRSAAFYESLAAIPAVRLVRRDVDSAMLLAKCRAVATVTGTAGWEALFQQKPVLLFGTVSYQLVPGVFPIKTHEACRRAFAAIEGGTAPTRDQAYLFLRAVQDAAVEAYFDDFYGRVAGHGPQENAERIGQALVRALGTTP